MNDMTVDDYKQQLLEVDRAFSALSVEKGMQAAFGTCMADDVIIYRPSADPFRGRAAALPLYPDRTDIILEWEPFLADVSSAGDLGYTLGAYTLTVPTPDGGQSVSKGHYVSIWKRQADGSWKFVFDTGHEGPGADQGGES